MSLQKNHNNIMVSTNGFLLTVNWAMVVWGLIFIIACASTFFHPTSASPLTLLSLHADFEAAFSGAGWESFVLKRNAWLGMVVGMFTLCVALFGVWSVKKQKRHFLFCYLIMFIVVLLLQIASVASIMSFSQQIELSENVASGSLTSASDVGINNAVFSLYTKCCSGCPVGCNNTQVDAFNPGTLPNCLGKLPCQYVTPCVSRQQDKCFNFFVKTRPGPLQVVIPTDAIDTRLCTLMSRLSYGGRALVGPVDDGGCGQGDPSSFHIVVSAYMASRTLSAAILLIVLICIEALIVPVCFYVVFYARKSGEVADEHDGHHSLEEGIHRPHNDLHAGISLTRQ